MARSDHDAAIGVAVEPGESRGRTAAISNGVPAVSDIQSGDSGVSEAGLWMRVLCAVPGEGSGEGVLGAGKLRQREADRSVWTLDWLVIS